MSTWKRQESCTESAGLPCPAQKAEPKRPEDRDSMIDPDPRHQHPLTHDSAHTRASSARLVFCCDTSSVPSSQLLPR